jgi:beta-glucosidase
MIIGLNVVLPWLLGTIEPLADAIVAGFDTRTETLFDAIVGCFAPTGRLPLTFPIDDDAIAVDDLGICASPNDVPGYAKEAHMNGRPYVYVDADDNRYLLGHGLSYDETDIQPATGGSR